MIEVGKYNELRILRDTEVGLFLGDGSGEDVLLPNKYKPARYELDDVLKVFVYRDYADRKVATDIIPKIHLHEFALLKVNAVANVGAFMDWGMEKDLMVPVNEQRQKLEEGRWYVVYLDIDEETDRLYASNKINKRLNNDELTIKEGEEVDLLVYHESELGYSVIIDNKHKGLVYRNEVFKEVNIGDKMKGFVKKIGEDKKIDVSLQALGYRNFNDKNCELIYKALEINKGSISITDKSSPEDIYTQFGISKKAFKKAVGALYKERKISIEDEGIKLV